MAYLRYLSIRMEAEASLKSIYESFLRKSIRFKLLVYFIVLILLPTLTIGLLNDALFSRSIEREANQNTTQIIEQIQKNMEFYIQDMDRITYYVSNNPVILDFVRIKNTLEPNRVGTETEVRKFLSTFTDVHPEISGITIVNANDLYISNEQFRITRDPLTSEEWYRNAVTSKGALLLVSRPLGRNLSSGNTSSADDILSFIKAISDPDNGQWSGVISIDFKLSTIEEMIQTITLGKNGFIYLLNEGGEIVYAPANPIVNRINPSWFDSNKGHSFVKIIKDKRYQIIYTVSPFTKWKVVGVFSFSDTLHEVTSARYYTIFIVSVTILLAIIVAYIMTSSIAKPLNKLKNLMKKVESGDLSVQFESRNRDEIGHVGNGFNNMLKEIRNLIDLVYLEQKSKRETELKILQAQIKPHFLYNTLEAIHWMAIQSGSKDLVKLIEALTHFFRIGLSRGKEFLTVQEEIAHVESYLVVQKFRYEDKLEYTIDCEERLQGYPILKLILQPLVENAIYHGIKERRGTGKIEVCMRREGDLLCLTVTDNGVGIPPERMSQIQAVLDGRLERGEGLYGYGIYNVNERIKLHYGTQYGITIRNNEPLGVVVTIRYPIKQEGEAGI